MMFPIVDPDTTLTVTFSYSDGTEAEFFDVPVFLEEQLYGLLGNPDQMKL